MNAVRIKHYMVAASVFVLMGFSLFHRGEAAGFWDQGMILLKARTEYDSGVGVTSDLTLSYPGPGSEGCLFEANNNLFGCPGRAGLPNRADGAPVWAGGIQGVSACRGDPTLVGNTWKGCLRYSSNTKFSLNSPVSNYWVISANSEPSFDQCNVGPPNYSFPLKSPALPGLFHVYVPLGAPQLNMRLDVGSHDFYCVAKGANHFTIPYLSVGAHVGRGQTSVIAQMNKGLPESFKVRFYAQRSYDPFGCRAGTSDICATGSTGVHAGFYGVTTWGGKPRMVWVQLFTDGVLSSSGPLVQHSYWNWPVQNSFFYPGGEGVIFNLAAISSYCGITYSELSTASTMYDVHITSLFKCASDNGYFSTPMPSGDIPLNGFHWFLEGVGTKGSLGMNIRGATVL